jgi:hypothetical protein
VATTTSTRAILTVPSVFGIVTFGCSRSSVGDTYVGWRTYYSSSVQLDWDWRRGRLYFLGSSFGALVWRGEAIYNYLALRRESGIHHYLHELAAFLCNYWLYDTMRISFGGLAL